ncbi:Serine protease inhibitor [Nesidiocoris tenuis]|uniref:Serine protease inhibitor n=1 Tax=Nesidiocoris tenuis TaxID=355587 RepID=A0ABN7AMI8_9HEMI|nr:Serine protease inhibitor [Nesidiocoris tenuis]
MNRKIILYALLAIVGLSEGKSVRQLLVRTNFVGEGSNDLAINLLQQHEGKRDENVVFSPLGYNAILALLAEGARGETRNQLAKALNFPEDTYAVRSTYKTILTSMTEHGVLNQPELKSWFYVYKNNSIEEAYKNVMKNSYLIDIKEVDRYDQDDKTQPASDQKVMNDEGSKADSSEEKDEIKENSSEEKKDKNEKKKGENLKNKGEDKSDENSKDSSEEKDEIKENSSEEKKDKNEKNKGEDKSDENSKDSSEENVTDNLAVESDINTEQNIQVTAVPEQDGVNNVENDDKPEAIQESSTENDSIREATTQFDDQPISAETTTENFASNTINEDDEKSGQKKDAAMLEEIIARNLKSEIRGEKEMMSALSANRLSSLDGNLRPNSRMIVFNALYFRGNWTTPMASKEDKVPFYTGNGEESKMVEAMSGSGEMELGSVPELGATALDIPYQGGRYSMLIIRPDRRDGLDEVLKKLDGFSFKNMGQYLTKRQVNACLPKFRFYTISKPKDALLKSGIKDIFGEEADLSGITGSKGLYLDDLVQLVTLDVDESSSSNIQLTTGAVSETRSSAAEFNANHPFAFVVRDKIENLIIVAGLLRNPAVNRDY